MSRPLAELEIHHSRPIAPTRRVALGRRHLPIDPAPGPGGLLLAGIVARFLPDVDRDFHDEYLDLLTLLQRGARVAQPKLRHRLQQDVVGLTRSRHRLERHEGKLRFVFHVNRGAPEQYVLAAAYAAEVASEAPAEEPELPPSSDDACATYAAEILRGALHTQPDQGEEEDHEEE